MNFEGVGVFYSQDSTSRYFGSRTRLHPQNSFVGAIFDIKQNYHKNFEIFENFRISQN